jgi:1-phosphofructokinase family hexose kinase
VLAVLICISANPAIDRRLRLKSIAVGEVNRALSAEPFPGGKAAHVAMVAHALGTEVMWVGFLGGAAGEECETGLSALGLPLTVVRTGSETRANLEIISSDGTITEILEPGGTVTESEVERFVGTCRDLFAESRPDTQVVISGSLPPGAPVDLYSELVRLAHVYNFRALLDTSGEALSHGLKAGPDLIKPNRDEASAFAGYPITNAIAATEVAQTFFKANARSVALSLGADGMLWQGSLDSPPFISKLPAISNRSSVGSGDAALAGFAVAYERGLCEEEAIGLAVACGAANCLAEAPGQIDPRQVDRLASQVMVQRLHSECQAK